nr:Uncharacterised protein [Streptococcus thermophilus]VDG63944.1 Uncharacterised protein [Streptococcus thermophilus]
MQKAGVVVLLIGLVTMIGSAVIGGIMIDKGAKDAFGDSYVVYESKDSLAAEKGEEFHIYKPANAPSGKCSVTAPDGSPVENLPATRLNWVQSRDKSWEGFDRFRAGEAGNYTFDCPSEVMLVPDADLKGMESFALGLSILMVGLFAGFSFVIAGAAVMIIAGVNKRKERELYQTYGSPPHGFQPPPPPRYRPPQ